MRRLLSLCLLLCIATSANAAEVKLLIDRPLPPAAAWASQVLTQALQAKGKESAKTEIIVGIAGQSPAVDNLLAQNKLSVPEPAESLLVKRLPTKSGQQLLVAGRDERGLAYALLEAARAVRLSTAADPLSDVIDATESPQCKWRSMTVHLFNAELEEKWYFDEKYWERYLELLATSRYNNLTLTFADQTNYLNPPYAFLVDVPGFPVQVKGLSSEQRQKNLAMLRRISELTRQRGLHFTLGIWTQLPVDKYVGGVEVTGLPEGQKAAEYCAKGLAAVLKECSAIDSIQFRMNAEAGVAEDKQTEFYTPLFAAIAKCGRPVLLDLRFKGLRAETIQRAVDFGLDVAVSTKFWCEHFGLPYHPTVEDTHYRENRYGFGAMLKRPHPYRVIYQLWNVGSSRLLLWGEPTYAARFAESCSLGGGEGFEIFAPLTDKGFGNLPGDWPIFKNEKDRFTKWEFERYWFYYLSFGRMGYNPKTNPSVWRRELATRFGKNAISAAESAYILASTVLPLVSSTQQLSAGEWVWWAELDTGDRLQEYMHTPTGDTAQFAPIRSFKPTQRWRGEAWDTGPLGYTEEAVAGRLTSRTTPLEVGTKLLIDAVNVETSASLMLKVADDPHSAEVRTTARDFRILASLAKYHAFKKLAATELAFFQQTNEAGRLTRALDYMRQATNCWKQIVVLTKDYYTDNLVFGFSPQHGRRTGHHHSGNWADRLPEVLEDVAYLEKLNKEHASEQQEVRLLPGEDRQRPKLQVEHEAAAEADSSRNLPIAIKVTSNEPVTEVWLYFRALDQTANWQRQKMQLVDGEYRTDLSHDDIFANRDLQYYFDVRCGNTGALWPRWRDGQPYYVVKTFDPKKPLARSNN